MEVPSPSVVLGGLASVEKLRAGYATSPTTYRHGGKFHSDSSEGHIPWNNHDHRGPQQTAHREQLPGIYEALGYPPPRYTEKSDHAALPTPYYSRQGNLNTDTSRDSDDLEPHFTKPHLFPIEGRSEGKERRGVRANW